MIKVSRSLKELSYRISQTREKMADGLGREPTLEELSQEMGIEKEELVQAMEARERLNLCIARSIKKKEVRFRFWTSWKKKNTGKRKFWIECCLGSCWKN